MKALIQNNSVLFIVFVLLTAVSSCNWFDCRADGCLPYEFTLDYSIVEHMDTMKVGDTLTFIHEVPFVLREDKNGVEYDINELIYEPELQIIKLGELNTILPAKEDDFQVFSTETGSIRSRVRSDGFIERVIEFEELEDRNSIELKFVPLKTGEYAVSVLHFVNERFLIDVAADTCCVMDDVNFDYNFINDDMFAPSRFQDDSIWSYENSLQVNMLQEDQRFDFCTFVIE